MTRLYMLLYCCVLYCYSSYGQAIPNQVDHICSRVTVEEDLRPTPEVGPTAPSNNARAMSCQYTQITEYAALTKTQLFNYLISEDDPFNCVYRNLFDFNTAESPLLFTNAKVNYIAQTGLSYASNYNGQDNNGLYGIMAYLSIASQMSTFHNLNYTAGTWSRIKNLSIAFMNNPQSRSESSVSLRINAEMYNTVAATQLNGMANLVPHTKALLNNLADDTYINVTNQYDYYYCYYFLLDVYLRSATMNSTHADHISTDADFIYALRDVAINMNLNDDSYQYFDDIGYFSVQNLARYASYPALANTVGPALLDVTDVYDEYSVLWTTAAIGMVQNDLPFPIDEEEIIDNLEMSLLPNEFVFDEGKFIISTPLSFEESKSLYEGAQQVRAQFFRLLQNDEALPNDINDTLRVKLYGTPSDYQNYNGILFDVNYPNSGGVYIEAYGTFYTYQRTAEESTYTVEELFRHEYAHYLQGRFLIPGLWAGTPYYSNNRLVWFEEGMAQFLAGSTIAEGIKGINVVRNKIISNGSHQSLTDVFNSSYSSGNFDAFYIYGPMLWSSWYENSRSLIKDLMQNLRDSDLTAFDNVIDYYRTSSLENNAFHQHIDTQLALLNGWTTPSTDILDTESVDFANTDVLESEIINFDNSIIIHGISFSGPEMERKFTISGELQTGMNISSEEILIANVENQLDQLLSGLASQSSINSFAYATAYIVNIQTGMNASGDFYMTGPAKEGCGQADSKKMSSRSFSTHSNLYPTILGGDLRHQFRYKELDENTWIELDVKSGTGLTKINDNTSLQGYEYQVKYECSTDQWSTYSDSKYFYQCPDQRDLSNLILTFDASFRASDRVKSANQIISPSNIELVAGEYVELLPEFSLEKGAELLVDGNDCGKRQ